MVRKQEFTCLHTDEHGAVWGVEVDGNPKPYHYLNNTSRLRAGTYLVLGCVSNYQLITQLYSALSQKEEESSLSIGAPIICQDRNCDLEHVLSCLSTLNVHDSLTHCWHKTDSKTFNTMLLLHRYQNEGSTDLTSMIYSQHCLNRYFRFLGLTSVRLVIHLIAEIVDPRWYLNPRRPYSLSRIESYFGLKRKQFVRLYVPLQEHDIVEDSQRRTLLLMEIVNNLPIGCFVDTETEKIEDTTTRRITACRLVLGFIVRNWLSELGLQGYFDSHKFFKQISNLADFKRQFKE